MDMTDYKKFWRGEFSLGQAFWIMYFGINCALGFAVLLLMFVLNIFKIQSLISIIYFGGVIIIAAYTTGFRRSQKPCREWEHWRVAGLRHRRGPDHSHRKKCCSRQSDDLAAGPRPNFVAATPRRDEKSRQRTEHPIKSTKLNSREVCNARNGRDDDRCDYG